MTPRSSSRRRPFAPPVSPDRTPLCQEYTVVVKVLTIADDAFRKSRRHNGERPAAQVAAGNLSPRPTRPAGQTEATNKSLSPKKRPARTSGPERKALQALTQRESPNTRKPGSRIATIRPPRNSAPTTPTSSAHHTTQCAIATTVIHSPAPRHRARGKSAISAVARVSVHGRD